MNTKSFFLSLAAICLLFFSGCTDEEQSELSLLSIEQLVTISGSVAYNIGVDTTSTDYVMEIYKPAINRKVFIEVAYNNYKPGATGIKIFETVTDSVGNFSIQIPTTTAGIVANIRMEEFTAYYSEYIKMVNEKPLFKTRLRRFEATLPVISGLKPGAFKFPSKFIYNSTEVDLEDFNEKITLTGNVQLAYETAYRTGTYKPVSLATVELKVTYDPLGSPITMTFGTSTDASGNYSVTIPLKSFKEGFVINNVSVLGIGQNTYTHYNKNDESVTLTGAYQTTSSSDFPVSLNDIIDDIPHSLGKQFLKFTPNFNNGLPTESAPESWSDNLAGWEQYAGYNEKIALTGSCNLSSETSYGIGNYSTAISTIKINVTYGTLPPKILVAATKADGSFNIDLPAKKTTDSYSVTIIAPEESKFVHFKSDAETTTLRGSYILYKNIRKDAPQWNELGDFYYKFTPTNVPSSWHANLAGWVKIKDRNLSTNITGKVFIAKEDAYATGSYAPAVGHIIAIDAGGNTYEAPVASDGTLTIPVPIENNEDELTVTLSTSVINDIKDFVHYAKGGANETRILSGKYTGTQLKPATSQWKNLGDIYYKFSPTSAPTTWEANIAGWQVRLDHTTSSIIRGTIKLPIETEFHTGNFIGAPYQIVRLSSNGFTLVGTTDINGEFAIPVPLKYADEEPTTTWDVSMNTFNTNSFAHYRKPAIATTEILSGSYNVKLTDLPEGSAWNRIGTRYYNFTPSGSPTNWSSNLPGWVVIPNKTSSITIKGKVKKAVQIKNGSNWTASWNIDANRMITVTVSGINYAAVTNPAGNFSFELPVVSVPVSSVVSIIPDDDATDVVFTHHPDIASDISVNIYGKFSSKNNISVRSVDKNANNNLFEVTESAKMTFIPNTSPDGWGNYSWNAIIANEQ